MAHSRSPAIHTAALAAVELDDWTYQRLPVPPALFAETVRALGEAGFVGANVTIPHKHAALALADRASEAARAIGAANTLTFAADGAIVADNTDAPGLIAAMQRSPRGLRALVLGAGGSARAAVWALREAGAREVLVCNRTAARAEEFAGALGARAVPRPQAADVIVNCTSVGLEPPASAGPERPAGRARRSAGAVQRSATEPDTLNQLGLTLDLIGSPPMSSTWSTEKASRRCSPLRARGACRRSTGWRSSSPRARSASNCGPAAPRRWTSCAAPGGTGRPVHRFLSTQSPRTRRPLTQSPARRSRRGRQIRRDRIELQGCGR